MKARLQYPMHTAAALTATNPLLLKGEVVYESDTLKRKLGDGITAWNDLPYESANGSSGGAVEQVTVNPGQALQNVNYGLTEKGQIAPIIIEIGAIGSPSGDNSYIGYLQCISVDAEQGYWLASCVLTSHSDMRGMFFATIESGTPVSDWNIIESMKPFTVLASRPMATFEIHPGDRYVLPGIISLTSVFIVGPTFEEAKAGVPNSVVFYGDPSSEIFIKAGAGINQVLVNYKGDIDTILQNYSHGYLTIHYLPHTDGTSVIALLDACGYNLLK